MNKEIAQAFLIEAKDALEAGEILLRGEKYSKVVQNSQLALELTLKAALILKNIVIQEHKIFFVFAKTFKPDFKVESIKKEAELLERQGLKPKYPLFEKEDFPVWIPSQEYKKGDAEKFLKDAKFIFNKVVSFLQEKYALTFPTKN